MGLFFEILSIVLWRSFDVLGQFTREARARLHAPSERLDEAAIAFPAAGLGGGERGVRQGRGRGQPEADEQRHRFVRSEERRVGKACVSMCRSGGSPSHLKE